MSDDLVWDGKAWVKPKPPAPGSPEADVKDLRQMLDSGDNKQVVKKAEDFLERHAGSPVGEEVMNLAGQAEMNRGHYFSAYEWFSRQITNYPNGPFLQRALDREYAIADAFLLGRKRRTLKIFRLPAYQEGIDILTQITSQSPNSEISEKALIRIADYYFNDTQYPQAIDAYDHFVKQFSRSPKRVYAMIQAAKANLLSFQGINWEVKPLLEAQERFRVIAQAYPHVAKSENIPGILDEIYQTLAHKVYHTGQFYERTKHPQSAVYYYRRVVKEFPDTTWAKQAKERLSLLGPLEAQQPASQPVTGDVPLPAETQPAKIFPVKPDPKPVPLDGQATPLPNADRDKTGTSKSETEKTKETGPIRLEDLQPVDMME